MILLVCAVTFGCLYSAVLSQSHFNVLRFFSFVSNVYICVYVVNNRLRFTQVKHLEVQKCSMCLFVGGW